MLSATRYLLRMSHRTTPVGAYAGVAKLDIDSKTDFFQLEKREITYFAEKSIIAIEKLGKIDFKKCTILLNPTALFYKNKVTYIGRSHHSQACRIFKKELVVKPEFLAILKFCHLPRTEAELIKKFKLGKGTKAKLQNELFIYYKTQLIELDFSESRIDNAESFNPIESSTLIKDLLDQKITNDEIHFDAKISLTPNRISESELIKIGGIVDELAAVPSFLSIESSDWFDLIKKEFEERFLESPVNLLEFLYSTPLLFSTDSKSFECNDNKHFSEAQNLWKGLFNQALIDVEDYVKLDQHLTQFKAVEVDAKVRSELFHDFGLSYHFADKEKSQFVGHLTNARLSWLGLRHHSRFFYMHNWKPDNKKESANSDVLLVDIEFNPHAVGYSVFKRPEYFKHNIRLSHTKNTNIKSFIEVSELELFFKKGELILYSPKLKKRIIPQITSSYNVTYDPHPLFRFLIHLGMQKSCMRLNYRFSDFEKNHFYTPGIIYKDILIKPKTWRLSKIQLDQLVNSRELRQKYSLPDNVLLVEEDRKIPLDFSSPFTFSLLTDGSEKKDFFLEEDWLLDNSKKITYQNDQFNHEILFNHENSHKDHFQIIDSAPTLKEYFYPQDGLINFALFFPRHKHQDFLVDFLLPFVEKEIKAGVIQSFYFIRYPIPNYQLRIRFLYKRKNADQVSQKFFQLIKSAVIVFHFEKVELSPLEKELVTYGGVEGFLIYIKLSSIFSLNHLQILKTETLKSNKRNNLIGHFSHVLYLSILIEKLLNHPTFSKIKNQQEFCQSQIRENQNFSEYKKAITDFWNDYRTNGYEDFQLLLDKQQSQLIKKLDGDLKKLDLHFKSKKISISREQFFKRIIHMEVFRLTCGEFEFIEMGSYEFTLKRILRNSFLKKGKNA